MVVAMAVYAPDKYSCPHLATAAEPKGATDSGLPSPVVADDEAHHRTKQSSSYEQQRVRADALQAVVSRSLTWAETSARSPCTSSMLKWNLDFR